MARRSFRTFEAIIPIPLRLERNEDFARVARAIAGRYEAQQYTVHSAPHGAGWRLSIRKHGFFPAPFGIRTALNARIEPGTEGALITLGIGLFDRQTVSLLANGVLSLPSLRRRKAWRTRWAEVQDEVMADIQHLVSSTGTSIEGSDAMKPHIAVSPRERPSTNNSISVPLLWLVDRDLRGAQVLQAFTHGATLTLADSTVQEPIEASLFHSGSHLYLSANNLPAREVQSIALRVSPHRMDTPRPGDYLFRVTAQGEVHAARADVDGSFVPLEVSSDDAEAVVASLAPQAWSVNLRISLEWFGGYARTDALYLAMERDANTIWQQWPRTADSSIPGTWGELLLMPVYPRALHTGSLFLPGSSGYAVVPYSPALHPHEITIECWVRLADDSAGTLIGNGRAHSYWLGVDDVMQFGYAGDWSVFKGQIPLTPGWHHVAITMAADGSRALYVDGQLDVYPGWKPAQERRESEVARHIPRLGRSHLMLRIGSDRDVEEEGSTLRGYIRELRIWNHARSGTEIRGAAFERLKGSEPGLVALWPFTQGLQDLVAGHDAGLIGGAALAREALDVSNFPEPRISQSQHDAPIAERMVSPWDAHIPMGAGKITLDGVARFTEYAHAATLRMEPDRKSTLKLALRPDALYLATGYLFGQFEDQRHSALTLWINCTGQGGSAPGATDLCLRLTPDSQLQTQRGDGQGFRGEVSIGISSAVLALNRFNPQEDIYAIDAPCWMGEVRIALEALAPFLSGESLRLAVKYEGAIPPKTLREFPDGVEFVRRWPEQFDEQRPETWGLVTTSGTPPPQVELVRERVLPLSSAHQTPFAHDSALPPDFLGKEGPRS